MSSTRTIRFRLAIGLALALAACAPRVKVTTTLQPGADLTAFATYALVPPPEVRDDVRERVEGAITEQLDARGYRLAPLGESDLLVLIQGRTQTSTRQVFAESPGGCCRVESYTAGTLLIEFFDGRSGKPLWRGVGEVDLHNDTDRSLNQAASTAVTAILREFPGNPLP